MYVFSPMKDIKIFIRNVKKIFWQSPFDRLRACNNTICVPKDFFIGSFFAEWYLQRMRYQKKFRLPKVITKLHFLNGVFHYISRFFQETCEIYRRLWSVNIFWYNGKLLRQWRKRCDFYLCFFANQVYKNFYKKRKKIF